MYTPRFIALLLSVYIGGMMTAVLYLTGLLAGSPLFLAGSATFLVSCIFIFFGFKKLFFDDLKHTFQKIDRLLETLSKNDLKKAPQLTDNLLKNVDERINFFIAQKQIEIDNLKKLERFRTEFVADLSHELKTPLFAVQGFIHTLLDGAINDDAVRIKFLKKAAKNLDALNVLIYDLLTLSQIEMGHVKMQFDNIDLYSLCIEVIEQFDQKSIGPSVSIQPPFSGQLIVVCADWLRITQVMRNLISNAIMYTDKQGSVTVRLDIGEKFVTVSVKDTGIGIPSQHLNQIFRRFYRVDKSRSKEKGGTGLGLSIVKHILEGHHSKITVKSEVNKGSTFSFKLPLVRAEKSTSSSFDKSENPS